MVNGTLENKAGVSLGGNWTLLPNGTKYTIQNNGEKQLSVKNSYTDSGSEVVMEALDNNAAGQKWEKSNISSGYFTLKDPKSGKFLTAASADTITIEGK